MGKTMWMREFHGIRNEPASAERRLQKLLAAARREAREEVEPKLHIARLAILWCGLRSKDSLVAYDEAFHVEAKLDAAIRALGEPNDEPR